jgi:hypothetical protein
LGKEESLQIFLPTLELLKELATVAKRGCFCIDAIFSMVKNLALTNVGVDKRSVLNICIDKTVALTKSQRRQNICIHKISALTKGWC